MEKKIYITPLIEVTQIASRCVILASSGEPTKPHPGGAPARVGIEID
jgi:hypothetical protein